MKRRTVTRLLALGVGMVALSASASAYYYYLYFANGIKNPGAPLHYDLNTLPNNKLSFYISGTGPSAQVAGDSFQALVSEVRAAADVWNSVSTSAIRLSYGGLFTLGRIDNSPSVDVEFSDNVPPGLLAIGAPESFATSPSSGPNGPFIPITRSLLLLPRDMTNVPVYGTISSYSEAFFVTLVHEFGHTLGLQHTLTSSVMSTLTTSASSKSAPLGDDDRAGISLLYPTSNYLANVGNISGRVTLSGTGVGLASVVAISPTNQAISTLTNPDGSYQINGIAPGPSYFVYVHPLPPPASGETTPDNIFYPFDVNWNPIPPNYDPATKVFAAQFYSGPSGTRDWTQAQSVPVTAGATTAGINFSVSARNSETIYSVRALGYVSQAKQYVSPAPVMAGAPNKVPLAATGGGLLGPNQTVTPGLNINTLGSVAQMGDLQAYPPPYPYIEVDVLYTSFGVGPGPKHLLFSTPADLYVLPSAFNVVLTSPPFVSSVNPTFDSNGNRAVTVAGTNLTANTRILFDGLQGAIESANPDGSLLVTPPSAPGSYTATVVALNPDGQSSLFLQPAPPTYTYDPAGTPSITVSPSVLVPGADVTVTVAGVNTNFSGQTQVGFGTSDIVVKQVTAQSPTQLTVIVTANAPVTSNMITVTTGLSIISQSLGFQVTATDPPTQPSSK